MANDEKTDLVTSEELAEELAAALSAEAGKSAPYLIVLAGPGAGRTHRIDRDETMIGRGERAQIQIRGRDVSRQHAKVMLEPGRTPTLIDLGSSNGTFCNGRRVTNCALHDGDKVQIGGVTVLKFSVQGPFEEQFQRNQYESVTRDLVTGCYNRRVFLERAKSELHFAARHRKPLTIALLDIDRFKSVNDTYGHSAGDCVLRALGGILSSTLRTDDLLARYGGEEFALLLREIPPSGVRVALERLRTAVETKCFEYEQHVIPVTISIGAASYLEDAPDSLDELIELADRRLYQAKEKGRNRVVCES